MQDAMFLWRTPTSGHKAQGIFISAFSRQACLQLLFGLVVDLNIETLCKKGKKTENNRVGLLLNLSRNHWRSNVKLNLSHSTESVKPSNLNCKHVVVVVVSVYELMRSKLRWPSKLN